MSGFGGKENPFDKSKKSGSNDSTNSLENIKNPFGSNAKPINTSHRKGNNSYRRNGNKPLIDQDKIFSHVSDNKKNFISNRAIKGETEQKIIKNQSIGLFVTFILIVILIFFVINFGKYLIRDYNISNPESSYSFFPDGEQWRNSFDYETLVYPELISGPDLAGNFNPHFFVFLIYFRVRRTIKVKKVRRIR